MKRIKIIIIVFFLLLLMTIITILLIEKANSKLSVQDSFKGKIIDLDPESTIYFEDIGLDDFTCTGISFDLKDNAFWIADYGKKNNNDNLKPRLIEINDKFNKTIRVVELNDIVPSNANLQGIAYNYKNDSILCATGKYIIEIDKEGNVLNKIFLKKYNKLSANGITYDMNTNDFYVLFYSKYLLKYDIRGNVLEKYKMNYTNQDHLYYNITNKKIYVSIGADYNGNNNFVLQYDIKNSSKQLYRTKKSYAIEGIYINNNKLYVLNDGFYHSAKIKKSYINIYNIKE